MGDIQRSNQYLSNPSDEVEKKWVEVKIQEKKSQMARAKQDIEDLKKGKIVQLEAGIIMLEKDIEQLQEKYKKLCNIDTIDVENKNQGGN